MLRIQLAAVLILSAGIAQAASNIDKYLGEYSAVTVCDTHSIEPGVTPHILKNGKFVIAKYIGDDGIERAIIVGNGVANEKFSDYDWYGVRFEYKPGREFDGIKFQCPDIPDCSDGPDGSDDPDVCIETGATTQARIDAHFRARQYTLLGRDGSSDRRLNVAEIKNISKTLKEASGNDASGICCEHLEATHDFHGGGVKHTIEIYKYGDHLFINYWAAEGGIHAGHVHN